MSDAEQAVTITRSPRVGMISVRGDLASPALRSVCADITGLPFPEKMCASRADAKGLFWMSPDEVLVIVPRTDVDGLLDHIRNALQGAHFMAENLSDARAHFVVQGPFCREVIAKNAPVDLHPDSFVPGQFRRSRLGQVAAAFWMRDETTFEVVCFASVADYVQELLEVSARMGPVGHF